ncbi:hypothetical protein P3L10_031105 [Capsicum annuum]
MKLFYYVVFGDIAAVVADLELGGKTIRDRITTSQAFNFFKNNYILVYSLMMVSRERIYKKIEAAILKYQEIKKNIKGSGPSQLQKNSPFYCSKERGYKVWKGCET